ncbi:aldo/keto reductase [Proteiniclasticum sp. SCR006]|uniref:Aldo/keto reductase n=1 Tax=Proteiniclasticum aestuarii TaxID=2817862 RepID=A0A939KLZ4_9CLOT|nr:aldo/keto reductase [Proteiniclasticum aestuarii]MBO1266175.1 aldo/keto reductase [Proteiniclasticum aestuarii]
MEKKLKLNDGTDMPKLGQGAWYMGENTSRHQEEIDALRLGVQSGMTLIDTAEMYGDGLSEVLVGEAIKEFRREDLFLVSKVYPHNAGRKNIFHSLKKSLERLDTPYLDLYLLHWRGGVPLSETVDCMEELKACGLIKNWGVSNFDTADMKELLSLPHGDQCRVNQVLYNLGSRGVEYDLLPYMRSKGIALMAYCPLAHDDRTRRTITNEPEIRSLSERLDITPEQLMLSFLLAQENVCAIPKASSPQHVRENADTLQIELGEEEMRILDSSFPAPTRKVFLDML